MTGPASSRPPEKRGPAPAEGPGIPKILHQTFRSRDLPADVAANVANLRRLNPDWEYRFYDDGDLDRFVLDHYGERFARPIRRLKPSYGAAKADLFRYLVLYRMGGVYLDIKSTATRPLDEVIRTDDQYLLSRWENQTGGPHQGWGLHRELRASPGGELQQWFIAAAPEHPFLAAVLRRVLRNLDWYNPSLHGTGQMGVLRTTGPIAYTLAIDPIRTRHAHRMVRSEIDLAFRYSIFPGEGHTAAMGRHYSQAQEPLVELGLAGRVSAAAIGTLRACGRRARQAAARPGG